MQNLSVGQVYCVYVDEVGHDKICVCIDPPRSGFFYINSENKKRWDCISIKKNGYRFLHYDSFISCHNVYWISRNKLNDRTYRGQLKQDDISNIYNHVVHSETLTPLQVDQIKNSIANWRRNL